MLFTLEDSTEFVVRLSKQTGRSPETTGILIIQNKHVVTYRVILSVVALVWSIHLWCHAVKTLKTRIVGPPGFYPLSSRTPTHQRGRLVVLVSCRKCDFVNDPALHDSTVPVY
jgi:hypothetical protein